MLRYARHDSRSLLIYVQDGLAGVGAVNELLGHGSNLRPRRFQVDEGIQLARRNELAHAGQAQRGRLLAKLLKHAEAVKG